jgi:outer membrane protein assembly factor BamA
MKHLTFARWVSLLALAHSPSASAQYIIQEESNDGAVTSGLLIVPYIFSSETLGIGVGAGGSYIPQRNPHSLLYGAGYATDNGSAALLLGGFSHRVPGTDRLFINPYAMLAHFTRLRVYANGNPDYPLERAGSHNSSSSNFIEEDAQEIRLSGEMRYILPLGHRRDTAVHTYITQDGLLTENPSGGTSWNPLKSGQSSILFTPTYRRQFTDTKELEALYVEFGVEHDNRDFKPNPHRGHLAKLSFAYDPNWLGQTREWSFLEGELSGYFPLPNTSWSRQHTLALSGWTAFSPTYDPAAPNNSGMPPYYAGPVLGGLYRLRGYPANRFHDKAAVHYSAEYRLLPEWQPLSKIAFLDPLKIRWVQVVGIVEVGRVAPSWDLGTLHTDMKSDYGVGLRSMFNTGVGRIDLMFSEEGVTFVAMFNHPF